MNLDIKLPECPICKAVATEWNHSEGPGGPVQRVEFRCGASYAREAKADFKDRFMPYGPWSAFKAVAQCSNATRIALELLSKQQPT